MNDLKFRAKVLNKKKIHGNTIIWRYMSFEKFLSLILSNNLYFVKVTDLPDNNECEIPNKNKKQVDKVLKRQMIDNNIKENFYNLFNDRKINTYVNCWSENQNENYALWKIYLNNNNGIAIKTTVGRLIKSIQRTNQNENQSISLTKVEYIEFLKHDGNNSFYDVWSIKKIFYKYEDEIRLGIMPEIGETQSQPTINNKLVSVDIDLLIKQIYLSPFSDKLFVEIFYKVIKNIYPLLLSKIKSSKINES